MPVLAQLPGQFKIEATLESWAAPVRLLREGGGEESCFASANLLPEHRAVVFTSILEMDQRLFPWRAPSLQEGVAVCL